MGRFQLELIYLYFPPSSHLVYVCFFNCPSQETEVTSTPTRPVDNVDITTKGLQDRNIHILDGTTVENKGKLILIDLHVGKVALLSLFLLDAQLFCIIEISVHDIWHVVFISNVF